MFVLIFVFRTGSAQVSSEGLEINMGLVPVTELHTDEKWITVYTTVPVDLISGNSFLYLNPGAYRVRKNVLENAESVIVREHNFADTKLKNILVVPNAIELLSYTQEGIFPKGKADAMMFQLLEKATNPKKD